ncbi:MAG: PAS domain-containing protein [Firmicutes bacterium]|nr:PAS domain-containing protein [Bacillota bacterium]
MNGPLWLLAPFLAVGAACLLFWAGLRAERARWWPLQRAARVAVERAGDGTRGTGGGDDPHALARRLSEVVSGLQAYRRHTAAEVANLRAALDGLEEGVVLLDGYGSVMLANAAARKIWGALVPTVRGPQEIELFGQADVDRALSDVRRDGRPRVLETAHGDPPRIYEVRIRPLARGDAVAPALLAVTRDMTEIRAVERMRREFVANASHELRTPLTAIQGYADTLREGLLDEDTRRRYLERIAASADAMARIVDDMLTLARVESFETPLRRTRLDLAEVAADAAETFRPLFAERGLRFSANLAPAPAFADADQLQHVAANLLSNAARYTPPGGSVHLRTEVREADGRRWAALIVEDTGIGIPPEHRTRIFERFYRVDRGRSREAGGTGLGLAIVKHIVARHEGRVWVEGREGPGSRFVVLLPAEPQPSEGET